MKDNAISRKIPLAFDFTENQCASKLSKQSSPIHTYYICTYLSEGRYKDSRNTNIASAQDEYHVEIYFAALFLQRDGVFPGETDGLKQNAHYFYLQNCRNELGRFVCLIVGWKTAKLCGKVQMHCVLDVFKWGSIFQLFCCSTMFS